MTDLATLAAPIIASLIFLGMLALVFSEKLNRTLASIAASALMILAGRILGFYTEKQAIETIDMETLGLLLGMMLLVALLEPTGFFQLLAIWAGRLSKGRPLRLMVLLGSVTTVLSMFLDNVTTAVLIAPVTILICEILGLKPVPFLMAEALLSNTGGVATLIGDPPNVLIAAASGFTFNSFLTHTLPVVVIAWLMVLLFLRRIFADDLAVLPENTQALLHIDQAKTLTDISTARRVLWVLGGVIAAFFLQSWLEVSPAFIALSGAAVALVWVRPNLHDTLHRVEWEVLLFFVALFVTVGGLEAAGILHALVGLLLNGADLPPVVFGLLLLWFSAGLSAIVDNVPITIALIPVIEEFGLAGMNPIPLWWALAFGAGFGGNGTIIGSTANIIIAGLSQKTRTPITPALWNRRGLPVMLLTCTVASLFYLFLFPLFER